MKRNTVLKQQYVKRKNGGRYSELWRKTRDLGSWCLKISALLTGLAGISVLFVFLYSYLLTSPYIRLEQVEIVGVDEAMTKELREMSGLNFELSLLAIDVDEVQKKLEKHPWVRTVEVEKQFPHGLLIRAEKDPWSLKNLSEIHVKKDGDVSLYFSFLPAAVKLRAQNLESKMEELKRVVEHLNSTGRMHTVKAIHLNYGEGAVVSFKKG
jgi:cell division septal protein FtsQ